MAFGSLTHEAPLRAALEYFRCGTCIDIAAAQRIQFHPGPPGRPALCCAALVYMVFELADWLSL